MRRTLALAGIAVLGVTGLSGPASADPGAGITNHGDIIIREVAADLNNASNANFSDIDGTVVEIMYHAAETEDPVSIAAWRVLGCSPTGGLTVIATINGGVTLDPGETYLVGDPTYALSGDAPPRDQAFDGGAPDLAQSDGAVELQDSLNTTQDAVRWGTPQVQACASLPNAGVIPDPDDAIHQDFPSGVSQWVKRDPTPTDPAIPLT